MLDVVAFVAGLGIGAVCTVTVIFVRRPDADEDDAPEEPETRSDAIMRVYDQLRDRGMGNEQALECATELIDGDDEREPAPVLHLADYRGEGHQ